MNHRQSASAIVNTLSGAAVKGVTLMEGHDVPGGNDNGLLLGQTSVERLPGIDPEQSIETFQLTAGMIGAMGLQAHNHGCGLVNRF